MAQKVRRLSYFSVMLYHLTGERAYRGNADSPAGFLKLTTAGRKSGKQRTVHLVYIPPILVEVALVVLATGVVAFRWRTAHFMG